MGIFSETKMGIAVKCLAVDFGRAVKDIITIPVRVYQQESESVDGTPAMAVFIPALAAVLPGAGFAQISGTTTAQVVGFGLGCAFAASTAMGYMMREFTYGQKFTAFPSLNPSSRTPN